MSGKQEGHKGKPAGEQKPGFDPKARTTPAKGSSPGLKPVAMPAKQPVAEKSAPRGPVRASLAALDGLQNMDTLVLLVSEDQRPLQGVAGLLDWRMCGGLSELLLAKGITGARGERVLTHTVNRLPVQRVIIFGIGPADLAQSSLRALVPEMARVLQNARCERVALAASCPGHVVTELLASAPKELQDRVQLVFDEPMP